MNAHAFPALMAETDLERAERRWHVSLTRSPMDACRLDAAETYIHELKMALAARDSLGARAERVREENAAALGGAA